VLTAQSKDLPRDREPFFLPLKKDLELLEEGIPFNDGVLKCGLVAYFSDNLEVEHHRYLKYDLVST